MVCLWSGSPEPTSGVYTAPSALRGISEYGLSNLVINRKGICSLGVVRLGTQSPAMRHKAGQKTLSSLLLEFRVYNAVLHFCCDQLPVPLAT